MSKKGPHYRDRPVVCHLCKLPWFQLITVTLKDGTKAYEHSNPKVMCVMAEAKRRLIEAQDKRTAAAQARELKKRLEKKDAKPKSVDKDKAVAAKPSSVPVPRTQADEQPRP